MKRKSKQQLYQLGKMFEHAWRFLPTRLVTLWRWGKGYKQEIATADNNVSRAHHTFAQSELSDSYEVLEAVNYETPYHTTQSSNLLQYKEHPLGCSLLYRI